MHDVSRDSLFYKAKKGNNRLQQHDHHDPKRQNHDDHIHGYDTSREQDYAHEHPHGDHEHPHKDHEHPHHHHEHPHNNHEHPHGHNHKHKDITYEEHDYDTHVHSHDGLHGHAISEDRAFTHLHEHGHTFSHVHHHTHHSEYTGIIHKIFGDPVRDWFGAFFMMLFILLGYYQVAPGLLSNGMLVCAAVIGIYPVLKNGLFEIIAKRKFSSELVLGTVLVIGLISGKFLEVALVSLLLLVGSFLRLNFAWRHE